MSITGAVAHKQTLADMPVRLQLAKDPVVPGSASELSREPTSLLSIDHEQFLVLAENAKVVSFDVFDTLVHRAVLLPRDIFALVGKRLGVPRFAEARFAAEARARRSLRAHSFEVSLDEIYAQLPADLLPDRQTAQAIELEVESEFLFANNAMLALVQKLRSMGKRVIAITDTYLSASQVVGLLAAKGYELDAIYASSDHREANCGKYNGAIYPVVCEAEGIEPHELFHTGDHSSADVAMALEQGVVALQSQHPTASLVTHCDHFAAVLKEHRGTATSLVAGAVARDKLNDRQSLISSIDTFGHDFGGPLVVGFVAHILERCRSEGIEHLVLLARDGCVVGEVLDILAPEGITWRLIPASRRLTAFPAFESGDFEKIKSLFAGQKRLSKRRVLSVLRLDHLAETMSDIDEVEDVRAAVEALKPLLVDQARKEKAALEDLLSEELAMLDAGRRFAWVDVGWTLTSPSRLNEVLGHEIPGFFIGSHAGAYASSGFEGYLFNRGRPHNLSKVMMRAVELFELVFADSAPSAAWLRKTPQGTEVVHYTKSPTETVRDAHIRAARAGVRRFAEGFRRSFRFADPSELRAYNRAVWKRLCSEPPAALYKRLSVVPHDALAGTRVWRTIGELWLPRWRYETPDRKTFPTARAYRIAFLRRYLKWHLPPFAWYQLRRAEGVIRKFI